MGYRWWTGIDAGKLEIVDQVQMVRGHYEAFGLFKAFGCQIPISTEPMLSPG